MQGPRCRRSTVVEDSRGSDAPEAMAAQARVLKQAILDREGLTGISPDKLPFRLRRRRCPVGHLTWTIEIDRTILLILLERLDLDDVLP